MQQIETFDEQQLTQLVELYQKEWWTIGRQRDDVREMLKHGVCIGFLDDRGRLAAFARVLTDFVFRATLYDVIVREDLRGSGMSRRLLDAILGHPRLARIKRFDLFCKQDKVALYEKWGFSTDTQGLYWMRQREGVRG